MPYLWIEILSYSIMPAAVVCLWRQRNISRKFYPFAIWIYVSLLNELLSTLLLHFKYSNAINSNCFVLIECWLLMAQFARWGKASQQKRQRLRWLAWGLTLVWVCENVVLGRWLQFGSLFRIVYACTMVLLAIDSLNALIILERKQILRNAVFVINAGLIVFFSFKAAIELYYALLIQSSKAFEAALFLVMTFINVFCNGLYTLGALWIPRKQKFSPLY